MKGVNDMTKKDLKKLIRQDIISSTPDILSKIDISRVMIEPGADPDMMQEKHHPSMKTMKLALSFVLVITCGLFLIFSTRNSNVPPAVLTDKEQIYTFSAVSAASLFNSAINIPEQSPTLSPMGKKDKLLIEDSIDILNQYMNVIETLIGNRNVIKYEMLPSDRQDYLIRVRYTIPDLIGNTLVQEFYYNETVNDESSKTISGIMLSGGKEFILEGRQEEDSEETKLTLVAYDSAKPRDNYVRVIQKEEQGQQRFSYEVVENGNTIKNCEIKLEMDQDDIKAVLSYENENAQMRYEFKKEIENQIQNMSVKYRISSPDGDEEGILRVLVAKDETTGSYIYQYHLSSEDTEKDIEKERNKHQEDDDDEKSDDDNEEEKDTGEDDDEKKDEEDGETEENSESEEPETLDSSRKTTSNDFQHESDIHQEVWIKGYIL
jgi:hypothetical protein